MSRGGRLAGLHSSSRLTPPQPPLRLRVGETHSLTWRNPDLAGRRTWRPERAGYSNLGGRPYPHWDTAARKAGVRAAPADSSPQPPTPWSPSFAHRCHRLGVSRGLTPADARAAGSRRSASSRHLDPPVPGRTFPFGLRLWSLLRFTELSKQGPARSFAFSPRRGCCSPATPLGLGDPTPASPSTDTPTFYEQSVSPNWVSCYCAKERALLPGAAILPTSRLAPFLPGSSVVLSEPGSGVLLSAPSAQHSPLPQS